jgi:mRNA-degrading endonuclease RelE of RelBE toxin-antitoxin system
LVFKVLLHPSAAKTLKKLDEINRATVKEVLGEVAVDPWKAGKPLHPSDFGSTRKGDYRAICEINSTENRVTVLFVDHRKKMYGDFTNIV